MTATIISRVSLGVVSKVNNISDSGERGKNK